MGTCRCLNESSYYSCHYVFRYHFLNLVSRAAFLTEFCFDFFNILLLVFLFPFTKNKCIVFFPEQYHFFKVYIIYIFYFYFVTMFWVVFHIQFIPCTSFLLCFTYWKN